MVEEQSIIENKRLGEDGYGWIFHDLDVFSTSDFI